METTLAAKRPDQPRVFVPEPTTLAETGLDQGFILDLTLKSIYYAGRPSARAICDRTCLPFSVMEGIFENLRRHEYIDIVGSGGILEQDYQYTLTSKGMQRAQEALEQNLYEGPAPVPYNLYVDIVARQGIAHLEATPARLAEAFQDLILEPQTIEQIGVAVGSGRSVFLYGPPGNGKSTIAECIVKLLSDWIYVPYAIEVSGQIIRVHDPRVHLTVDGDFAEPFIDEAALTIGRTGRDRRWVLSRRPLVITGGEMTLEDLDLRYSDTAKYYIAPLQVKANNGILVIDDFGRQRVRPEELLNRWMVPMDRNVDHLVFQTGELVTIPFDVLLVFATNLTPSKLGDEAFFRRIRHKIRISDPDEALFKDILKLAARRKNIIYSDEAADYLIDKYYRATARPFRGVHPRDLLDLIDDMAKYRGIQGVFDRESLDLVCRSYFVED